MGARVNLYEDEINNLVINRGNVCEWERAMVCHCVTKDSGQPDFMCPTCGGSGYRYLPKQTIKVAVSSLNSQVELETMELREPGTAYITPTKDIIMGYKDRLRFPDFKCIFSEVLHWSEEENGRGISPKTYRNIKEVICLADDEYEYELGVDFEITEDKYHLRWKNKEYIDKLDGKDMSLLYYTTPSYLVIDLLHELRATLSDRNAPTETFRELPKQYKVQREDFIYKISDPKPVLDDEKPKEEKPEEISKEITDEEYSYDSDGGITIE